MHFSGESPKVSDQPPPEQYVHPFSCARFTPHVPEGMSGMPGSRFAAHSLAATSLVTLALCANSWLRNWSATLQAPKIVPLAWSLSIAMSSIGNAPGFCLYMKFLTVGAL